MKRILSILGIVVLTVLLLLVRAFEDSLFYDPLLDFYKIDYKILPLPKMDFFQLFAGISLRFFLNTVFSLGILWFAFRDSEIIKFSAILYLSFFVVLFVVFSWLVLTAKGTEGHLYLFYVRRFLIQPLFLLLLLPAFYFQKYKSR